jgi:hypothetical protein
MRAVFSLTVSPLFFFDYHNSRKARGFFSQQTKREYTSINLNVKFFLTIFIDILIDIQKHETWLAYSTYNYVNAFRIVTTVKNSSLHFPAHINLLK